MDPVRKSPRNASPAGTTDSGLPNPPLEAEAQHEKREAGVPLPVPQLHPAAPTAEDARNVARLGMRDQMSQFRTTQPPPKVKLRVKQYDPSRRSYFARNDDAPDGKDATKASDKGSAPRKTTGEKVENKIARQSSSKDKQDEKEFTPKTTVAKQTLPTRPPSARSTPSKAEDFDGRRLRTIVNSAANRAVELGNEILGKAIRLIHEDSLSDPKLSQLLHHVLQQKQSEEENLEFQHRIKLAKRRVKKDSESNTMPTVSKKKASPKPSSKLGSTADLRAENTKTKPISKSPVRRTRQSAARIESGSTNNSTSHVATPQPQANGKMSSSEGKRKADEPPAKRVKRSRSASSTSSLSSTHSLDIDPEIEMSGGDADGDLAEGRKGSSGQPPKGNFSTKASLKKPHGSLAGPKLGKESAKDEADDKEREAKKRKLARTDFDDYHVNESSMRSSPRPRLERIRTDTQFPNLPSAGHSARGTKIEYDDMNSPASSIQADLLVPPPPEARRTSRSRAATPNMHRTRGTLDRGKARIKESPMKRKNGVIAGIAPRSTRAKDGAAGAEQTTDDEGENVDFCSSCGDQGKLLCCDGCTRSFHFKCLDPPIDEDHPPEGRWFCKNCHFKRNDSLNRFTRGLFSSALTANLTKQNPVAFGLPHHIRDFFEGVGTSEDGEYVEVSNIKTRPSKVPGYDEVQKQDNLRLKDAKNQIILCFSCGLSSLGKREIVACDYCGLHWHLDCVNPPLANPPFRDPQNRAKYRWMCPAHSDPILSTIGLCGRRHKTRRPKNAEIVDTQLRRGFKSNGLVEIELDPSDDEMEIDDSPKIYRVTETNVLLDFNDRLRKDWEAQMAEKAYAERLARQMAIEDSRSDEQSKIATKGRSVFEQDAVLALCKLAEQSPDSELEPDKIKALITVLLDQASDDNILHVNHGSSDALEQTPLSIAPNSPDSDTSKNNNNDRAEIRQLLLLQELIRKKLTEHGHD